MNASQSRSRPVIAFFDYPDVFEDFYSHYGIDQKSFATTWADTGNHAGLSLIQKDIGDIVWFAFSVKPQISLERHAILGCQIRMLPSSWLHRRLWRTFYMSANAWRWRKWYRPLATVASYTSLLSSRFLAALREARPDFIFVQDYASGRFDELVVLSRILGSPLVARHAGSTPDGYLGGYVRRWTLPRASHVITDSREEANMLADRFHVPRDQLSVVLTPIDTTAYVPHHRTEACHALKLDERRRYLVFVGRLVESVKRIGFIIRSFAAIRDEHPDVGLIIVGDGPDHAMLQEVAERCCPNRVCFLGWVSHVETRAQIYNVAECLLMASPREGFPTVVGEAMSCGTPVLATDVGGIGEVVHHGESGWLAAAGDDRRWTEMLADALSDRERLAAMRLRAREIAESRVSPRAVAGQLRNCFLQAEQRHSRRPVRQSLD